MRRKTSLFAQIAVIVSSLALSGVPVPAQNTPDSQDRATVLRTNSKISYHDGPVRTGVQHIYFIFYGCWHSGCNLNDDNVPAPFILADFASTIGNTSYLQMNSSYTDSAGSPASAAIVYAGTAFDSSYSHGGDLTVADIQGIIADQFLSFSLPQDPQGIYVVAASADIASQETRFCTPGAPPFHGSAVINGGLHTYVFLGGPTRCPTAAAPQFVGQPTPNNNFTGDAMVTNLAHALNGLLTNPYGSGWFDRYGLENADKCAGTFGQTYTTPNGARANIHLNIRDFLLEQNWVNARKAFCGMSQ